MRRAVLELASSRPIWRVTPRAIRDIRRAFGRGWEIVNVTAATRSDGDGGGGSPRAIRAMRGAEVYFGFGVSPEIARAGLGTLRWAHSAAAGVGSSLTPELDATGARFTNSRAVHAEPMADWVIAAEPDAVVPRLPAQVVVGGGAIAESRSTGATRGCWRGYGRRNWGSGPLPSPSPTARD